MLITGARLGPYEITAPLGAGGMGQVYRARDTRLGRDVAIKVLNPQVSANADLKARFEREARAISALQHPHICVLHDIGHDGASGTDFLVMEYLEGETLAERIARAPLPLDQALKIGIQIADALDKAHRAGILHRDLKPGNIMLTGAGAKLLDFGLAKPAGSATAASAAPLLSAALTLSSPQLSPLTTAGTIVGTVQYMSPEQIQGAEADPRSDIFALGSVLYEMFSGKRPFEGQSQISVASAILEKDPEPITATNSTIPPELERFVRTCLAKNPADRVGCAQDVKLSLQWVDAIRQSRPATHDKPAARRVPLLATAAALVIVAAVAALGGYLLARPQPAHVLRAVISTPDKVTLDATGDFAGPVVISPDGQTLAFVAHGQDGQRALWVRQLSDNGAHRLDGTEDAYFPFWSADGRYIAFFAHGKLNKIPAGGGPVLAIGDAVNPRGGSWGAADVIVYAPDFQAGLVRVSAQGGAATQVTKFDGSKHTTHRWPAFLPDGKHFLYLAANQNAGSAAQNGVYIGSTDGSDGRMVLATDSGAVYANGYLLFHAQNALMAQPFDPSAGTLSGEPAVVVDRIAHDPGIWRTIFAAANNGTVVYQGGAANAGSDLVWVDRTGRQLGRVGARASYSMATISPDDKRIVASIGDPKQDLFIIDTVRGTSARLTFDSGPTTTPGWSPDGKQILYSVFPGGSLPSNINLANNTQTANIYIKRADGVGASRLILEEEIVNGTVRPAALSPQLLPDGQTILYLRRTGPSGHSIYSISLAAGAKPVKVIAPATSAGSILDFRASRDGRWIAYSSDETGRPEVFVVPYPNTSGARWQITSDGGQAPAWRADGKELYLQGRDSRIDAVSFSGSGSEPEFGSVQPLFPVSNTSFSGTFDVAADGQRFLLNVVPDQTSTPISLLVNWPEELKKK